MPATMITDSAQERITVALMNADLDFGQGKEADELQEQARQILEQISGSFSLSPVARLRELSDGWDGRDASRPSERLLASAESLWRFIDCTLATWLPRPKIKFGRAQFVSFTWIQREPRKELHIWLHDSESFDAEWHLRTSAGKKKDGRAQNREDLLNAINQYFV